MAILYKYVPAERVTNCLPEVGNGTLRATQLAALNDPFECALTAGSSGLTTDRGIREASSVLTRINPATPVTEEDVKCAMSKYGTHFVAHLAAKQASQRFGIVSLTTDPYHPLMWSIYANDGAGFVLGYDTGELEQLCEFLLPVLYELHPLVLFIYHPLEEPDIYTVLTLKGDQWSFENEWRMIVQLNKTVGTGLQDQHGQPINLLPVPNEAVKCVYYTERTPEDAIEKVGQRLQNPANRYNAALRKLVRSERKFGYEDADQWTGFRYGGKE